MLDVMKIGGEQGRGGSHWTLQLTAETVSKFDNNKMRDSQRSWRDLIGLTETVNADSHLIKWKAG